MSIQHSSTNVDQSSSHLVLRDYALTLHEMGFNVLPLPNQSKATTIEWKRFQKHPQTEKEVTSFPWQENIAIINGPNGLRTIDIDNCHNSQLLEHILFHLGLEADYPWITYTPGKGGGYHIHLLCHEPLSLTSNGVLVGIPFSPKTASFKQIELRWHSCYTLLPPSLHPEEQAPYQWAFEVPSSEPATIATSLVESLFVSLARPQKDNPQEEVYITDTLPTPTPSDQKAKTNDTKENKYDAWSQKALIQELEILQAAPKGKRNHQLNKSAYNLGQIVGAKQLNEQDVITALTRTATFLGLGEGEIRATLKSGLESGKQKPRLPKQVFKSNEPPLRLPLFKNIDEQKLANFSADDQGNAEAVHYLYNQFIAFNEAYGWLIWNSTHFSPSQQRINTLIVETLRLRMELARKFERTELAAVSKAMAGRVAACRTLLENIAYVEVSEFDSEPDLINVANGIIDLRTKTLLPHSTEYRFTWCSPIRYLPNADNSFWVNFLFETVNTQEMVNYMQEALGYSITGHTSEECLFYVFGPPRSGKGTMSEIILAILPRPIAIEVDFNTFTAKREGDSQNFDLAPLKAARIVFASESNKYQSLNPAKIKQLTGGNLVYCSFKHKDMFNYRPQYSMWLSSNHEVNADADDDALWGRTKVIPFPNSKLGTEDKTLKLRMQSPDVLEGVLTWLVDGSYLWYQNRGKGLVTPDAVKQLTQQQRDAQDSVGLWLEECCELDEDEWTENSKIRFSYENWCQENGYEPKKAKGLSQSLAAHGIEVSVQKRITGNDFKSNVLRGVNGLKILTC